VFKSLKPYAQKGKEIGEGLDHIGAGAFLLFPNDPKTALTIALVSHALAKTLRGVSILILGLSTEDAATQNYLSEPERLRAIRRLIVHQAYLEEISSELLRLPKESELIEFPNVAFSLITDGPEPPAISPSCSLVNLESSEEIFAPYRRQLEDLVVALCRSNPEISINVDDIDQRARQKAIAAIEANPLLSQVFVNNTLKDISAKLGTLEDAILNPKRNDTSSTFVNENLSVVVEQLINNRFAKFEEKQQIVSTQISEIHQRISPNSLIDATELTITKSITQKIKSLFDRARFELQKGSLRSGESGFKTVIELSEGLEGEEILELRARSTSNLGLVLYINGDTHGGAAEFESAYEIFPSNSNIAALKGLALHLKGQTDEAIAHLLSALEKNGESEAAITILAQLLEAAVSPEAAIDLLEKHPLRNEGWYDTFGRVLCSKGAYVQAVEILNEGLSKFENSVALKIGKAVAISMPLTTGQLLKYGHRPPDEIAELRIAEALFKEASNSLRNRDRNREFIEVLLNHAAILLTLDRSDDALHVLREAELIDCSDTRLLNLLVGANWSANHLTEAKKYAELHFAAEQTPEVAGKLVAILISSGLPEEALALIERLESQGSEFLDNTLIQSEKLDALRRSHNREAADNFAVELAQRFPQDAFTLGAIGDFYDARNDPHQAEEFLTQAIATAKNPEEANYFRSHLGEFFYRQRDWRKAIENLHSDFENLEHCRYVREIAHSYLEVGDIETAAKIVFSIPREDSPPDLLEIRSWVEHQLFHYEECRDTLKVLSRKAPRVVWSLKLADASNRVGKREIAYGILRDLFDQNPDDIEVAVMVSQACYMMNFQKEAFAFARDAYLKAPNDQRVKSLISRALLFDPDEVELTKDDARIVQECLVDNDSLEAIPITTETSGQIDVSPILDRIRDNDLAKRELLSKYHQLSAPLSMLLSRACADIWSAWKAMAFSSDGSIYMSGGTQTEQENQIINAAKSKSIVMDFSSILTLAALDKFDLILRKYDSIYISSDTVSNFQQSLDLVQSLRKSTGSMLHQDGRFYFIEQQKGESDTDSASISNILDFLDHEKVQARGLQPRVLKLWKESEGLKLMPEIMFLPIGVSLSMNLPYYTDQLFCGATATSLGNPGSFCTQAFLRSCLSDKIISEDDYEEAVIQLVGLNYNFTSISKHTLLKALQRDGGESGEITKKILARCCNERARNESTSKILGDAASTAWLDSKGLVKDRNQVLYEFADAAGVFEQITLLPVSFVSGFSAGCVSIPSAIFGMLDTLKKRESLTQSARWSLSQLEAYMGVSVLRGLNSRTDMWFPMHNDWFDQTRLQRIIFAYEKLHLQSIIPESIQPNEVVSHKRKRKRKIKYR
jgi:tetratricopeptide (TPR) repeat protein